MTDSLPPNVLRYTRLPCPSPLCRACSNSCALTWWCHPTILCSVVPFSSCILSFPASESFLISPFFASGSQSIGVSPSASVSPMNIQGWFSLELTMFDLHAVQGTLKSLLQHHSWRVEKHQFFDAQSLWSNSHIHTWLLEKPQLWLHRLCWQNEVSAF